MSFTQSFKLALKSLRTSKMRALLTMLGIIIGVGAVIVILSLGNGMQNMMNEQFEKLGSNLLQVQVWRPEDGSTRNVEPEDLYALAERYPQYLSGVSPYVSAMTSVSSGTLEFDHTSVYGVSEDFFDDERMQTMSGGSLAQGRFLSYVDVSRYQNVCVVGSYIAQEAFRGDALDKTLTVGGVSYRIVGVLEKQADNTSGSGDDQVYIPYTNARLLSAGSSMDMYMMTSTSKDTSTAAKGIVERLLYDTYLSSDYYMVITSAEMMDVMNTMMNTMMIVLVAIAAISLVVGGIGIMNIMLVSVTERTREIGIRKSLGAKRANIRSQFIIEAGTTSAIGGILGIAMGMGLANVVGMLIGSSMSAGGATFTAVTAPDSVLLAFGVSVGIGVLFGYLPANKAAKLNPIDALRYD